MTAVWFRARAGLRAHARGWLAIAVLLGLFGGATAAVAAGARRTASAYPRFLEGSRAFDVFLGDFSVFAPDLFWQPDWEAIEASPLVAEVARVHYFFGAEDDEILAPAGEGFGTSVNSPKVLAGRLPDAADEFSVPFAWERVRGVAVGDTVTVKFEDGADVPFTVVGIHAMPGDFPPTDHLGEAFLASETFTQRYGERVTDTTAAFIRLAAGSTPARFDAFVREHAGGKLATTHRNEDQAKNVQRSFDMQAAALWFLAAGLALGLVLVLGQSIARQATLGADDRLALRAIGMSRGQIAMTIIIRALTAGTLGGCTAVVVAIAASPLFPRGFARVAEPSPGLAFDVPVLGLTFLGIVLLAGMAAAVASVSASRPDRVASRPSRVVRMVSRTGSAPPMVAGVRFALEQGHGPRAVPVRSTITVVALGLAALTTAFTFGSNLDAVVATPELYGRGWNHEYGFGGDTSDVPASAMEAARRDDSVVGAGSGTSGLVFDLHLPGGSVVPVTGIAIAEQVKEPILAVPTEGRYPGRDELALGPRTMSRLGLSIGDRIDVGLQGADAYPLTVVGELILPPFSEQSTLGDGVLISYLTLADVFAGKLVDVEPPPDTLFVRFANARPHAEEVEAFRAKLENVDQDFGIPQAADLVNFGRVQNLPLVLAGLLAALAAAALAHVLLTAIRRRRRDIAILKTLGFDRRQAVRAVLWQASAVAGVALLVGVPLGVLGGRALWSAFATRSYFVVHHATPWIAILLTIPAAALLANVIAVAPARAAARTAPATTLRVE